jgi:hypothetical protein
MHYRLSVPIRNRLTPTEDGSPHALQQQLVTPDIFSVPKIVGLLGHFVGQNGGRVSGGAGR